MIDFYVLYYVFSAFCAHLIEVGLKGALVEAKFVLYCKSFGPTTTQKVEDLAELALLGLKMGRDCAEEEVVELMIHEKDTGTATQDILIVGYQRVYSIFAKGSKCVEIHHALLEEKQELLHIIYKVSQYCTSFGCVAVFAEHDADELSFHASKHALIVIKVYL